MDKKDLFVIVVVILSGIGAIVGGWKLVTMVASFSEFWHYMLFYLSLVPGFTLMAVGAIVITITVAIIYEEVTGHFPWWLPKLKDFC